MSLKNFLTYIKNYMRFDPIPHKYYNNQNELYVSVTQLIEHYKQEFEEEYWSYYTAYRKVLGYDKDTFKEYVKAKGIRYGTNKSIDNIFYLANQDGISQELLKQAKQAVKDEWKETNKKATDKGSNFHNRKETSDDYQKVFTEKIFTARTVNEDLWNLDRSDYFNTLEDGWYREIKLVNHNHKLAGTIDELFIETIDRIRYIDINDWKTNAEIKFSNKFQNMKAPVSHLQDTNFNHYTLQISTYALMLELMGFKPRHLQLTHIQYINETEYEIPLPLKYLKQDVQNILTDYADKRIFFE